MAIEKIVAVWDERRALAAERDVGGAEVGDGRDTGAGGDNVAIADLKRRGGGTAEILDWRALMKNRLAMVAEDGDFFRRDAKAFAGLQSGFGVDFAKAKIHLAQVAGWNGSLFGDAEDFFADLRRKIEARVVEEFRVEVGRGAGDFGQGNIDAVGGGSGHEAEDEERFVIGRQG